MNCSWGFSWHGRYFFHSWLFWLLLILVVTATLVFLLNRPRKKQQLKCPGCNNPVEEVYLRCPDCGRELKSHCPGCSRIVDNDWQFCPHCKEMLHSGASEEPTTAGMSSA
jgi:predicted amidophosphoribosyltransferase